MANIVRDTFLFATAPSLADLGVRTAFAYDANGRAALVYERTVEQYHGALFSIGLLYGLQLLHIAYNAVAWEKGLLIVHQGQTRPQSFAADVAFVPDTTPDNSTANGAGGHLTGRGRLQVALRWNF